jgi:hypothetical protein
MDTEKDMLRFALASVWTELEYQDVPDLEGLWEVVERALSLSKPDRPGKRLDYCDLQGVAGWREYLVREGRSLPVT